ncbi:hypothetical protein GH714_023050 [Hevea brasiliensis]|uniref:FAS1 domain-containing protein n=1 Tax=Hevea brasiliensis TaxID=3981 RepID=A0A6A6KJ55_HEVBR|nr:hypothetical protein GH714_023050 [Hevea brasiliensis]
MQLSAVVFILLLLSSAATLSNAHNITRLLAKHPAFSTFNHYLTITHLAAEINRRTTITVCAVDNAAMSELLSKHPSIHTIKNILSLHVLLDYFGAKKLHQITNGTALAATMFQATGSAPGSAGFVNITDMKGGKVALGPEDNGGSLDVYFVKSLEEVPYNISVIQISKLIVLDYTNGDYGLEDNLDGGLTVFCPLDDPFKAFLPRFKNLTAAGKTSFLEFFGVPVYQSLSTLKSNNGLMNTLATDGANKFDFTVQNDGEDVTLKTKSTTAKITGTLIDEQPVAVYTINKVLLPKELFKAEAPTPAPAHAQRKPQMHQNPVRVRTCLQHHQTHQQMHQLTTQLIKQLMKMLV